MFPLRAPSDENMTRPENDDPPQWVHAEGRRRDLCVTLADPGETQTSREGSVMIRLSFVGYLSIKKAIILSHDRERTGA